MLRRLLIWTAVLFVILGGMFRGVLFTQEGEPQLWMVVEESETVGGGYREYTLYLQDPLTRKSIPLSLERFRSFLQTGAVQYNPQAEIEGWLGIPSDYGYVPTGAIFAEIFGLQYEEGFGYTTWVRPSPDWNWIVYRKDNSVFAANLGETSSHDLLAKYHLRQYDDFFGIAFSPDGERMATVATNSSGESGLYVLRLDGNNPDLLEPIFEGEVEAKTWTSSDWIIIQADFDSIAMVKPDGSNFRYLFSASDYSNVFLEFWSESSDFFIVSEGGFRFSWLYPNKDGYYVPNMTISGWVLLGITTNSRWFIVKKGNQIGRMRTDGTFFEVIAELPGRWHGTAFSQDGNWVAMVVQNYPPNYETLFRVNLMTGQVDEIVTDVMVTVGQTSYSPNGELLRYFTGYYGEAIGYLLAADGNMREHSLNGRGFVAWAILDELPK